jgi:hypothetical protein
VKNKNKYFYPIILVVLAILSWWGLRSSQQLPDNESVTELPDRKARAPLDESPIGKMLRAFDHKVVLYGQVVDQHGSPVKGAQVKIMPQEKPFADGTRVLIQTTDADGRFFVDGIHAFAVGIETFKAGYITISDLYPDQPASSRLIEYGLESGKGKLYTDPATSVVFTLQKPDHAEPLIFVKKTYTRIPRDGKSQTINLMPEDTSGTHLIEIRTWSDWDNIPSGHRQKFSWKIEINVPEGGLFLRQGAYDFIAPTTGYVQRIMFDFPASLIGNDWDSALQKSYFVEFKDGVYAIFKFDMAAYADNSMIWSSWLNPKSGSTNLTILPDDNGLLPE